MLLVGAWPLENYLGKRKLDRTLSEIEAELALLPAIPEKHPMPHADDNFFEAPFVSAMSDISFSPDGDLDFWDRLIYNQPENLSRIEKMNLKNFGSADRYPYTPHLLGSVFRRDWSPVNLEVRAAGFRAKNPDFSHGAGSDDARVILDGLEHAFGNEFAEFEAASQRPHARIPTVPAPEGGLFSGKFSPVSMNALHLQSILFLRMEAALVAGDSDVFWKTDRLVKCFLEGSLHSQDVEEIFLLRQASSYFSLFCLGIHLDSFSETELVEIQQYFSELPFSEGIAAMFMNKVESPSVVEIVKRDRDLANDFSWGPDSWSYKFRRFVARHGPAGLFDRNSAQHKEWIFANELKPWLQLDFKTLATMESRIPDFQDANTFLMFFDFYASGRTQLSLMEAYVLKLHIELACAIERFQKSEGRLPDDQEELVPDYLKAAILDPFDGKAMRFKIYGDEYKLYSIGLDGMDNGGRRDLSKRKSYRAAEGDWVWRSDVEQSAESSLDLEKTLFWITQEESKGGPIGETEIEPLWKVQLKKLESEKQISAKRRHEILLERAKAKIKQDQSKAGH